MHSEPEHIRRNARPREPAQPESEEELLDIVDEGGERAGQAPRSRCHGDPRLAHRAVHVLIRNSSGGWFLQKRTRTRRIQPGKWDSAVGGHLRPGESYEDAARRELEEELGIKAACLRPLHDYVWRTEIETEHVRTFLVTAEGPFRLGAEEIEEGRFWSEEEIRRSARTGIFTPNLEEEFRRVGVLPPAR